MDGNDTDSPIAALAPIFLILVLLIVAAILWCMLSSCLGTPILRLFSTLWEYAVLSARVGGGPGTRRRRPFGEEEIWEMEYRGRAG